MARPTKAEQERKRVEGLRLEGKGPDGEPITDADIISETKNPAKAPIKQKVQSVQAEFEISELEQALDNSVMGNHSSSGEDATQPGNDINNSDFKNGDKNNPNYIPTESVNPFAEPLIQNESDANKAHQGQRVTSGSGKNPPPPPPPQDFAEPVIEGGAPLNEENTNVPPSEKKPLVEDLQNLSQSDRRKQTEMFADSILTTYSQLLPMIPTMVCSYNMGKMELLDKEGVIRLSMVVGRDVETGDLTIKEVFKNFNDDVAEVFVVTEEMKMELREPLIAVLLEKGIAPTPMVSLLIGIGRHILMFGIATAKLLSEKKAHLEQFKDFRKQEMEDERAGHRKKQNADPATPNPVPPVNNKTPAEPAVGKVNLDDVINSVPVESTTTSVVSSGAGAPIKDDKSSQPGITIEEVLD